MATEHDLKLAVDFGGVSIGDATASIGVTVDRKDLDLATADEYFSGKRLEGQIRISNRNDDQPKLFDPGVEPPSVATTFDATLKEWLDTNFRRSLQDRARVAQSFVVQLHTGLTRGDDICVAASVAMASYVMDLIDPLAAQRSQIE